MIAKALVALLLFAVCLNAQTPVPRITDIAGYPLEALRDPQPGTPAPLNSWLPTPVPLRPLSTRVVYRPRTSLRTGNPVVANTPGAAVGTTNEEILHRLLVVGGNALTTIIGGQIRVKVIAPDATSCQATAYNPAGWGQNGEFIEHTGVPGVAPLPRAGQNALLTRKRTLAYFEIPDLPDSPHEFLMPWICVCLATDNLGTGCADNAAGTQWIHTNMRLATVQGCLGDHQDNAASSAVVFNAADQVTGIQPGYTPYLCYSNIINVVSSTQANGGAGTTGLGNFPDAQAAWGEANQLGVAGAVIPVEVPTALTARQAAPWGALFIERRLRTKCCGWRDQSRATVALQDPLVQLPSGVGVSLVRRFGVCINPLLESCCSRYSTSQTTTDAQGYSQPFIGAHGGLGKPYSRFREKCCYGGTFTSNQQIGVGNFANQGGNVLAPIPVFTSYLDDWCPCRSSLVNDFCNQQVPATDQTFGCCTKTKYPELAAVNGWGKCFNQVTMKCCDTGDLYDPGSKQCCQINGVQSVNVPCPCNRDSQCGSNQACCQDVTRPKFPTPRESTALCSPYTNYPSGTGPYEAQPCLGNCIDTRFQICCNGMACIDAFESCCNNTCCNKFNLRCTSGLKPGARGSLVNRKDLRIPFEVCTEIEGMTPFRATLAYFMPICLLAATFISLFATLNFAKRQSSLQPPSVYEKSVFVISAFSILLSWPLFFSPLYKYGIVWIWIMYFVMLSSLAQLRGLNVGAIILLGILLLYVIDPFYGNEILTLASNRAPPPAAGVHGWSGVLSSIVMSTAGDYGACTGFYDYFRRDPLTEDPRLQNPTGRLEDTPFFVFSHHTYGFCARGWYVALAVFEGINIILTFVLFFLVLVAHVRNILFEKAQKTDDVVRQPWY